ncbi:MAG: zonular occludens toxin domain-containing protein [Nitrosomonas ureae]
MITLITGGPGSGKTAYVVSELLKEANNGRLIYTMGIPELTIPHQPAPPLVQWTKLVQSEEDPSVTHPMFDFPQGSILVIDEAQDIYKPRNSTSRAPEHVEALNRHRHVPVDIILITQFPSHIDAHARYLVTKHIHLENRWAGGKLYEWSKTHDPSSRADRGVATTRKYSPPKHVFNLYKSSSLHIKQSRRIPFAVYVLIASIGLGSYLGYRGYERIFSPKQQQIPASNSAPESKPTAQQGTSQIAANQQPAKSPTDLPFTPDQLIPRINTRPESAPLYDSIRTPKSLPTVVGCVDMAKNCRCFTSQATDAFLTDSQCREWLKHRPFDPFKSPPSINNNPPLIASTEKTDDLKPIKRSENDLEQVMQSARK